MTAHCKNESKMNTLSERLKLALSKADMNQAELARAIGVRPQVIQYLCNFDPKSSKYTYLIADALKINPIWLATGSGDSHTEEEAALFSHSHKVPLLHYNELKKIIKNENEFFELTPNQWLSSNLELSQKSYAIRLNDKSMFPRFDEGVILIFDAEAEIKEGSIIMVYDKIVNDLMVRQLISKNQISYLLAINEKSFKTVQLSDEHTVFGILKEARWYEQE